ncbi:phage tail tube protein [Roseibium litorale]|nr:phage tail tube protein [Roseibium litorale]
MRKFKKLACLAKIETVYGTDSVPVAANAIQLTDVTLTPMAGEDVSRDLLLPYLGHQGIELTGNYLQLEFAVECAGAGAAGTVPGYGALLRACGLSETITAGVSVVYEPVSAGEEAVSIYFNQDGVRHVALGCRGTFQLEFAPRQIPRFRFRIMGLLGSISDQALPAATFTAFQKPEPVSKAKTSLSLHGAPRIAESVSIDLGVQIEPRFLIGDERMQLTDRQSTGAAVVEAKSMATINWFEVAQAKTFGALQVVHGTAAGHIVQLDAPKVQIGRPSQGQSQNILNYSLPLMFVPDSGDDELAITIK